MGWIISCELINYVSFLPSCIWYNVQWKNDKVNFRIGWANLRHDIASLYRSVRLYYKCISNVPVIASCCSRLNGFHLASMTSTSCPFSTTCYLHERMDEEWLPLICWGVQEVWGIGYQRRIAPLLLHNVSPHHSHLTTCSQMIWSKHRAARGDINSPLHWCALDSHR